MSPEDEAQLRQAVRKAQRLPEPTWNLIGRTTTRWSRFAPEVHRIETQQKLQRKKKNDKAS